MKKGQLLPFAILCFVALGCSAIREMATNSTNSGTGSNSNSETAKTADDPPEGAFSPSGDPRADIERMADGFMSLPSFRAKMEGVGQTPMKMDLDFVAPDRYHMKSANGMETIVIGKTTYMKLGDRWQKMPIQLDSSVTDMRAAFNREGMKWFSDVKYEGEDVANGKPAHVYTYHNKGPQAGVGENDSKIWIAKSDGRPVKIEAVYKSGNLKSMLIEYDYETEITIEPPVK